MPGFLFSGVHTTLQVPGTTIQTVTDDAPTIDTSDLQARLEELRELLGKDDPTDAIDSIVITLYQAKAGILPVILRLKLMMQMRQ